MKSEYYISNFKTSVLGLTKVKVHLLMLIKGRLIPLTGIVGYSLLNENRYLFMIQPQTDI